jgi:PAS domain-containing protein
VAVVDDEGRFVDAEGSTDRIFGLDRASLLGRRLAEFCAPQVRDLADGLMPLVEAARAIETRWLLYRASAVTTHVDFVLLCDEAGSHQHLAVVREVADEEFVRAPGPETDEADPSTDRATDDRTRGDSALAGRRTRPSVAPDRAAAVPGRRPSWRRLRDFA